MRPHVQLFLFGFAAWLFASAAWAQSLTISHDPVPFALRGQPLTLKAKVEGPTPPQSVTLYYALFRDAAPFRVAMKSSGLGYYVGAIEANLLGGVDSVSYYIEAQDENGVLAETPWYDVKFREPRPSERPVPTAAPPAPAPAGPAPVIPIPSSSEEGSSWKTPAVVVGSAAVILGGAYAISQSGGGGGDGGGGGEGGDSSTNSPGTYLGTVTTCTQPDGEATTCESHAFNLLIDVHGAVYSESLYSGQQLLGQLENNRFALTATVDSGGTNGTIIYNGTWVNDGVIGQISGSATSAAGNVSYSGTFSGDKQ